jgi:hypothetical protein
MNPSTATPPCRLLLDTGAVLELHRRDVWSALVQRRTIILPSIVAHEESFYYERSSQTIVIDLASQISEGKIQELGATPSEMGSVASKFDRVFVEGLHPGELEALAILARDPDHSLRFCTADKIAIYALVLINLEERLVSLEAVLREVGLGRPLSPEFMDTYLQRHREIGVVKRITGDGLQK